MMLPKLVGTFRFKRSTKRYHLFSRVVDGKEEPPQYVDKEVFGRAEPPEQVDILIRWDQDD